MMLNITVSVAGRLAQDRQKLIKELLLCPCIFKVIKTDHDDIIPNIEQLMH